MGNGIFKKFLEGILRARSIFAKGNIPLSDKQWKKLYSAFAAMALWKGISEDKVKKSRLEGYTVINNPPGKVTDFKETLKEFKDYVQKYGIVTGTSKKLAKDGTLDNVTNAILKNYDKLFKNESIYTKTKAFDPDIMRLTEVNSLMSMGHFAVAANNYLHNKDVDLSGYKNGYINDQNTGAVSKLRLGIDNMGNNGCEVIAVYNSLKTLGRTKDIRDIALHFEMDGQLAAGYWGTNPFSLKRYFKNLGYNVKSVEGEDIINKPIPKADTYILSFWNRDDVMYALHTVSVRPTKDGKFEVFNNSDDETIIDTTENLSAYSIEKQRQPLVLFCISN